MHDDDDGEGLDDAFVLETLCYGLSTCYQPLSKMYKFMFASIMGKHVTRCSIVSQYYHVM